MSEMTEYDISAAMALLDEKLKNAAPKRRGRKQLLAPYAAQLRKYVEAGWSRKEIVAEMRALGISISAGTLREVLGSHSTGRKARRVNLTTITT
jgi:hypothetical protein